MASFTRFCGLTFVLLWSLVFALDHQHLHRHGVLRRQSAPFTTNDTVLSNSTSSDGACYFWLEHIQHQGLAPFSGNSGYQVFRNVKDFGAVGDGVNDDTAAINLAISSGNRCGPGSCNSTTTTPALVYFPAGTYLISSSLIDYYYTQLIGNPNCLPTLKATSGFTGFGLIDGDEYGANGLSFGATNIFWRQVRNFVLDMTAIPGAATGVHWPTGQATSLQNIRFEMSTASGNQHQGVFIESGSGGFMTDLTFNGGLYGLNLGNQQFTMRNMTFNGCGTAINQIWNWGWTYAGMHINNCQVGLNFSGNGPDAQTVGSITFFDSDISNTPIGIATTFDDPSNQFTNGSLIVENVQLNNVATAIMGANGPLVAGSAGSTTLAGYGQGHSYTPNGPQPFQGPITPNARPSGLLSGNDYYTKSKPQYEAYDVSDFISARTAGARGDGVTDDTSALQAAITAASAGKKILFLDAGDYKVSSTLYIPAGTVITGEAYPVIIGSGSWFSDINNPRPIVQIGKQGEQGTVEWSDSIVSTQGATAGAILFEWNLASGGVGSSNVQRRQNWENWSTWSSQPAQPTQSGGPGNSWGSGSPGASATGTATAGSGSGYPGQTSTWATASIGQGTATASWSGWTGGQPTGTARPPPPVPAAGGPSGLWDVHARVGGFAGSDLQLANCPTTPDVATPPAAINQNCIAAFLTMHVTNTAANLYMENVWLWVADHDVEDPLVTQITIYAGRGLLIETAAPLWLWGTAVEHHTLYQYQLVDAAEIFMGQIQTETAYYQPNPPATIPFPPVAAYSDPNFASTCYATQGFNYTHQSDFTNNCDGWGLRIIDSSNVLVYGAGLYSFFDNYNTSCSAPSTPPGGPYGCQSQIFSIEGNCNGVSIYNLNTVGAQSMVDINGQSVASYLDNLNVFIDGIALFRN